MSAELLSKMTAKGILIDGTGFGGEVELTSADVAAALAGTNGLTLDFILLKYCGDETVIRRLVELFAREVRYRYKDLSIPESETYAVEVISENIGGDLCGTCNGTGTYRYKNCLGCKGTGKRARSGRARAEALNISRHEYEKRGDKIFRRLSDLLATLESGAIIKLKKKLYRFS